MQTTAIVNYHVSSPDIQAFHIDADGVTGHLKSPELVAQAISLTDLRDTDQSVHFADDSLAFAYQPSKIQNFDSGMNWRQQYDSELVQLLKAGTGAKDVIVFDHTIRTDAPNASRKPARNVHGDYSATGARQRLSDLLGEETADIWAAGHYAFINTWRPINGPVRSAPLGFVLPKSVHTQDWVDIELVYPDRRGQILGLQHEKRHEWVYLSQMTPDEIAFFNVYDNSGLPSIAHSAVDLVEDNAIARTRTSIESRTLVRYD